MDGLNGAGAADGGGGVSTAANGGNLAEQVVAGALRYRAQAPLVDQLLAEVGLNGKDVHGLTAALREPTVPSVPDAAE